MNKNALQYEGQKLNLDKTKSIKVAIKAKRENLWKLSIFQRKKKKTELQEAKSEFRGQKQNCEI